MEKEPITSEGLKKIKRELEELKNIRRPKIIEAILMSLPPIAKWN